MVLFFWQGIISIHQKTFLEALAEQPSVAKVILAVEHDITPYRRNMGWEVPEVKNVEVIISPSVTDVKRLFEAYKDAIHIMGGIRVGRMLTTAFDESVKYNSKVGIMNEPYDDASFAGYLRTLKYQYYRLRYVKHIQFVLAVGKQAVRQYSELGFEMKQVFPWAYFINIDKQKEEVHISESGLRKIIFAGRLEDGKGIYAFVDELVRSGKSNYKLDIYGSGPDEENIRSLVRAYGLDGKIQIYPFLPYSEMVKQYARYDWVVLPSKGKDGWGVIVSEGLLSGLKAICSNKCGASWAVKDDFNGVIFDWGLRGSCNSGIVKMLSNNVFAERKTISEWAYGALSADAGAQYFLKVIACIYDQKEKPVIPWE